jgi:PPK2 family polyphosphate:nucleotide phosphotransferase
MNSQKFVVQPGKRFALKDRDPGFTGPFKKKEDAAGKLEKDVARLAELQERLYALNSQGILVIFQAMDAAGKDSVIKHVMSGVNPQGCQVTSFKAPSNEELDHDYLWRCQKAMPERGRIGIFNRSYYEEVLVVRVHPEFLDHQQLPPGCLGKDLWENRYEDINAYERYLTRNGFIILKFFLYVSKQEQKKRFLERIDTPDKNWKFSAADLKVRGDWDKYMDAYEKMLAHTSTTWAPWYVIPADHKWFTRVAVANTIVHALESLDLAPPALGEPEQQELAKAKVLLEREK